MQSINFTWRMITIFKKTTGKLKMLSHLNKNLIGIVWKT